MTDLGVVDRTGSLDDKQKTPTAKVPKMAADVSIGMIRLYRTLAPSVVRGSCRFEPTCSCYAALAIGKYGAWTGWCKAFSRLLRCRPPHGGVDWP